MGWNYWYILKFNSCTVGVWEWISNFMPHFTGHVTILINGRIKVSQYYQKGPSCLICPDNRPTCRGLKQISHTTDIGLDDVIKWKHFPRYWPFVRGIHRWPVDLPHKGQWRGALMFSLICAWINGWVNNHETGDLRRHCTHYDVIVMDKRKATVHLHVHT